jgi:hypothetical protein
VSHLMNLCFGRKVFGQSFTRDLHMGKNAKTYRTKTYVRVMGNML